ncbi:MAG: PKD domain-containing protein [Bacteroidales bacterium]|nr:PKD domain-containing protein [Bacteroidales bacterium]
MKVTLLISIFLYTIASMGQIAECEARFNINNTTFDNHGYLIFEDLSLYNNSDDTQWYWSFENGEPSSSNEPNPEVVFPDSGNFEICLTITENNCSSTICDTIELRNSKDSCYAEFDYYCDGSSHVNFFNQSSTSLGTYLWTFGDGYLSNDINPIHIYSEPGFYEVCLIINSISCIDTICHTIFVGEPTGCQAFFENNPGFWPNTYDFDDLSMGDIVLWYWDFGDGVYSVSSGSVRHTYLDSGLFHVCLHVLTNSGCESSYCTDIYVENPMGGDCFSHFEIQEEYCDNCFSFHNSSDISTELWYWDFGDGETLLGPANPIHTYLDSGWYNVCLTIYTTDNCVATYCDSLFVPESISDSTLSISGHVYAGGALLPEGMAVLYKKLNDGRFEAITKSTINNGLYYFEIEASGNYLVYAVPHFEAEYYYPVYFPSYYGNELFWNEATLIYVNEPALNYVDIHLVQSNTLIYGKGETSGVIEIGDDAIFEDDIFNCVWFDDDAAKTDSLIPAQNITVLLLDTNLVPLRFKISNNNGEFNFAKLSNCHFIIYPEKAGLTTHSASIYVSEDSSENNFCHFTIRENDIFYNSTGITDWKQIQTSIFPNPVNDFLNVRIDKNNFSKFSFAISNMEGKVLIKQNAGTINNDLIQIPVKDLTKGFYIISIVFDDNYEFIRKFVK